MHLLTRIQLLPLATNLPSARTALLRPITIAGLTAVRWLLLLDLWTLHVHSFLGMVPWLTCTLANNVGALPTATDLKALPLTPLPATTPTDLNSPPPSSGKPNGLHLTALATKIPTTDAGCKP